MLDTRAKNEKYHAESFINDCDKHQKALSKTIKLLEKVMTEAAGIINETKASDLQKTLELLGKTQNEIQEWAVKFGYAESAKKKKKTR